MTKGDDKKPPRPDPFAPLPLSETLTGKTRAAPGQPPPPVAAPEPPPRAPEPPPPAAAPLPPTAFTSRVTGEHEAPVVPFDPTAYEPAPDEEPPWPEPAPEDPPWPESAPEEPAWTEPAALPPAALAPAAQPDAAPEEQLAWTEPAALATPTPAAIAVENELRDAVGATQIPDDPKAKKDKAKKRRASTDDGDDGEERPRKLWMLVAALAIVFGGGITAMVLVGRSNSDRFVIACEADRVVILQGRSFPPWGESSLDGPEWKSLKIPAEAACAPFETKTKSELAAKFGKMLEERATKLVGGRGGTSTPTSAAGPEDPVAKVDEAEAALKQALLVARWLASDDERITKREDLERLLGDVTYWRASARLRAAADALTDAAKQFDSAALQKPRTNTDAAGWAIHARRLSDELRAGPNGERPEAFPPMPPAEPHTSTAPPGVALPVEPADLGSAAEPAPPPIDAGAPSGGVLL